MRISLLEFDYHAEVLRNSLRILSGDEFEICVFTKASIWKKVDWQDEDQKVTLLKDGDNLQSFLHRHLNSINESELILINTAASNFKTWSEVNFTAPSLLRIHNGNANFNTLSNSYRPIWSPFFIWKDFSHFLRKIVFKRDDYFQKRFVKKIDHFAFPNDLMRDFAVEKFQLEAKRSWALPFSFWEKKLVQKKPDPQKIQISIIGKIDQRNRDYNQVVKACLLIGPILEALNIELELCLLGKAQGSYANTIIKAFKSISTDYFKVQYYPNFVPQIEFEAKIQNTDFLIIPTRIDTRFTIYKEWYGSTKISGSVNDVIHYHRFALIEGKYPVPSNIKQAFSPYHGPQDLADQIVQQIQSRAYAKLDFPKILADYQIENVRQQYLSSFKEICL